MKDTSCKQVRFRHVAAFLAFAFAAVECSAGRVFGRITMNGQPVANAQVRVDCNGEEANDTTDDNGIYRVYLRREGRCRIIVTSKDGIRGDARIYSYSTSSKQDFELSRTGKLRRK